MGKFGSDRAIATFRPGNVYGTRMIAERYFYYEKSEIDNITC
jgi:hypothetical protein